LAVRGQAHTRNNGRQQVLPAARTTASLGRVLGHSAPQIAAPAAQWGCIGGLARRSGHILACSEDTASQNVKVKPTLAAMSNGKYRLSSPSMARLITSRFAHVLILRSLSMLAE
jgi:hypothetical protein